MYVMVLKVIKAPLYIYIYIYIYTYTYIYIYEHVYVECSKTGLKTLLKNENYLHYLVKTRS